MTCFVILFGLRSDSHSLSFLYGTCGIPHVSTLFQERLVDPTDHWLSSLYGMAFLMGSFMQQQLYISVNVEPLWRLCFLSVWISKTPKLNASLVRADPVCSEPPSHHCLPDKDANEPKKHQARTDLTSMRWENWHNIYEMRERLTLGLNNIKYH